MLAVITKMSLTQVSTWFANARRRLKKENKATWSLNLVDQSCGGVEDDLEVAPFTANEEEDEGEEEEENDDHFVCYQKKMRVAQEVESVYCSPSYDKPTIVPIATTRMLAKPSKKIWSLVEMTGSGDEGSKDASSDTASP